MNRVERSAQQHFPGLDGGLLQPLEFNRATAPMGTAVTIYGGVIQVAGGQSYITGCGAICIGAGYSSTAVVEHRFDATDRLPIDGLVRARRTTLAG